MEPVWVSVQHAWINMTAQFESPALQGVCICARKRVYAPQVGGNYPHKHCNLLKLSWSSSNYLAHTHTQRHLQLYSMSNWHCGPFLPLSLWGYLMHEITWHRLKLRKCSSNKTENAILSADSTIRVLSVQFVFQHISWPSSSLAQYIKYLHFLNTACWLYLTPHYGDMILATRPSLIFTGNILVIHACLFNCNYFIHCITVWQELIFFEKEELTICVSRRVTATLQVTKIKVKWEEMTAGRSEEVKEAEKEEK